MSMTPFESEFYKMTAGGNDFILFDGRETPFGGKDLAGLIRAVCTRALSVGADGVIVLERSPRAHLRARFFNPDGGTTFCGNGARCAARLAYLKGMAPAMMTLETDLMVHRAEVEGMRVSIEMREPRGFTSGLSLEVGGERIQGSSVDTGVPHFVVFRPIRPEESIETLGRALRNHPHFAPEGTNVNFIQEGQGGALDIRTYERGVEGETLACGTGSVAAALAAAASERARSPVTLRTRSGELIRVRFEGDPRRAAGVRLEGDARLVFVGQLSDEAARGFTPGR